MTAIPSSNSVIMTINADKTAYLDDDSIGNQQDIVTITVVVPVSVSSAGFDAYVDFIMPDGSVYYKGPYDCSSGTFDFTIGEADSIMNKDGLLKWQFLLATTSGIIRTIQWLANIQTTIINKSIAAELPAVIPAPTGILYDASNVGYNGYSIGDTVEEAIDYMERQVNNLSYTGSTHDALVTGALIDSEGVDFGVGGLATYLDGRLDKWETLHKNSVTGIINVLNYGAIGDGIEDDTASIQSASNALNNYSTLYFPFGYEFRTTTTVTVLANRHVIMKSPIIFDNILPMTALQIGGTGNNITVNLELDVVRTNQTAGWLAETDRGIEISNCDHSLITINRVSGFTIGCKFVGQNSHGFAYNEITLRYIADNKFGVDVTQRTSGWCNENLYLGGRFTVQPGASDGYSRYGVRITSEDSSYIFQDQNIFIKPSFELGGVNASPGYAIPILIEHGRFNQFHYCRDEGNTTGMLAVVSNESAGNVIECGWSFNSMTDNSTSADNRVMNITSAAKYYNGIQIFKAMNIPLMANMYNGSTSYYIPGFHWVTSADNTPLISGTITISPDRKYILCYNYLPAVFIDTDKVKTFIVRKNAYVGASSYKGRLNVVCYDATGALVTADNTVVGCFPAAFGTSFSYGGSFRQTEENTEDTMFRVGSTVAKIQLIFIGQSNIMYLNSLIIEAVRTPVRTSDNIAPVYSGFECYIPGSNIASVIPTVGSYKQGKVIFNSLPAAGGTLGWVCTTTGTLGTLNSGATTGSIDSASNILTVNSATGLIVGQFITIAGVTGIKTIIYISGTTITIDIVSDATVTDAAVAFSAAVLKTFGAITA